MVFLTYFLQKKNPGLQVNKQSLRCMKTDWLIMTPITNRLKVTSAASNLQFSCVLQNFYFFVFFLEHKR